MQLVECIINYCISDVLNLFYLFLFLIKSTLYFAILILGLGQSLLDVFIYYNVHQLIVCPLGAIQVLRNADGWVVQFSGKKRYEGVRFNVILALQRGGWGSNLQKKALRNS